MISSEIKLRVPDLVAMVLKAAKAILCFLLILGLLGGAYGVYSAFKNVPKVTEEEVRQAEHAVEDAQVDVTSAERNLTYRTQVELPDAERKLERMQQLVEYRQEYLDNSLYYAINPFKRGVCRLTFYVKTDFTVNPDVAGLVKDPQADIVAAYTSIYPFDSEILDHVCTIMKIDVERRFIGELVSVWSISDSMVCIQVQYDDLEVAKQVSQYLYETMTDRIKGTVAEHTANVISLFTGYEVDWGMNDSHTAHEDELLAAEQAVIHAKQSLEDLRTGVTELESAVADAKDALSAAEKKLSETRQAFEDSRVNAKNVLKKAIKNSVIGAVFGLVLGCGIALFRGLFSGRIESQSEVWNRYAFPVIGVLPRTQKTWFDRTIRRLEGEPEGNFEATAQATAQSLLSRIGGRSVCLVSTDSLDMAKKLAACTEDRVKVLGSIIDDAASVKKLADFDGIVLVEQRGKSRLSLVDAEVLRAKALEKEILGIVLA